MPFPRWLLVLPEGGCALPGEGLHFWGLCPCTPLETHISILHLQIQPRAEQMLLPRVSDSHHAACSHPADFPELGVCWEHLHPGELGKATHFVPLPCHPPSQSLLDRELKTHRNGHIVLSAFRCSCNFWKCCSWQEPLGLLDMDKVPGAHPDTGLMCRTTRSAAHPDHIQQSRASHLINRTPQLPKTHRKSQSHQHLPWHSSTMAAITGWQKKEQDDKGHGCKNGS